MNNDVLEISVPITSYRDLYAINNALSSNKAINDKISLDILYRLCLLDDIGYESLYIILSFIMNSVMLNEGLSREEVIDLLELKKHRDFISYIHYSRKNRFNRVEDALRAEQEEIFYKRIYPAKNVPSICVYNYRDLYFLNQATKTNNDIYTILTHDELCDVCKDKGITNEARTVLADLLCDDTFMEHMAKNKSFLKFYMSYNPSIEEINEQEKRYTALLTRKNKIGIILENNDKVC